MQKSAWLSGGSGDECAATPIRDAADAITLIISRENATLASPPVFAAKALRRKAQEVAGLLGPVEEARRAAIANEESLSRYQLQTGRFQLVQAGTRVNSEEEAGRSILQFTERTERRIIKSRLQRGLQVDDAVMPPSPAVSGTSRGFASDSRTSANASLAASLTSAATPVGATTQRRVIGGTTMVDAAQRQFMAAIDQLERHEQTNRASLRGLEQASRHHMSSHAFYNEFYEFDFHLFDNVPRIEPQEAAVRARAMLMLHEDRARGDIAYEWYDLFTDYCKVLSPFIPALVNQLEWRDLLNEYFNEHFHYMDNTWRFEELYERNVITTKFAEEIFRVLAGVHAYVVIQEPAKRRAIRREERRHWSSLMAHEHPRIAQLRHARLRFVLRRYFRKLVGLRAYRDATLRQHEGVAVMESLALENTRQRYYAAWRRLVLRRRQLLAVDAHAKDQWSHLGLRYMGTWSSWSNKQIRREYSVKKLQRRAAELVQARVKELFVNWKRFRRSRQAEHLLTANTVHLLRRAATQWFWGCWRLKRRKQHRVKFFKLDRLAQQWRVERTFQTWGRHGFLALCKSKRERHVELATLERTVQRCLMAERWRVWKFFLRRRKQQRLSLKLERVNRNYIKVRRMATWLSLIRERTAVRKVNCLIVRLIPQLLAPWWSTWRTVVGRQNRIQADSLLIRNQERMIVNIIPLWQSWAHRHRYRRLVVEEGQLDHLALRNAFRYRLATFQRWAGQMLHRKKLQAVKEMEARSHATHCSSTFQRWMLFRIRNPQMTKLSKLRARADASLSKSSWVRWMRLALSKDKRADKRMIAVSLLRSNQCRWVKTLMRRFHSRGFALGYAAHRVDHPAALQANAIEDDRKLCRGGGRLARLHASVEAHHIRQRWTTWTHNVQLAKDTVVANNLSTVNVDRWRRHVWQRWMRSAHTRAQHSRVMLMAQHNQRVYAASVGTRVFSSSKWHVNAAYIAALRNIKLVADVRLMLSTLGAWVHHAKTWKRQILAETLRLSNAKILLQRYATTLAGYRAVRAVRRVSELSYRLGGDVAGRRYYTSWISFLRRRVERKVSFSALCMLREHWTRRNGWSLWAAAFASSRLPRRRQHQPSSLLPPGAVDDSAHQDDATAFKGATSSPLVQRNPAASSQRPPSGARAFLRSLRATEDRLAKGGTQ